MNRFDYIKYDAAAAAKSAAFKARFQELEELVNAELGTSRASSLVLTNLEIAYMWVGKAIRDEQLTRELAAGQSPSPDTPERTNA